jgi:hypothetical protein
MRFPVFLSVVRWFDGLLGFDRRVVGGKSVLKRCSGCFAICNIELQHLNILHQPYLAQKRICFVNRNDDSAPPGSRSLATCSKNHK